MPAETDFDLAQHLSYQRPARVYSFQDLGLDSSKALCDFAVSEPFQLLSEEGVCCVRKEIFSDRVQRNCKFTSKRTPSVLRGTTAHSRFLKDLWYSKETQRCICDAVGQPLTSHPIEYEVAHTNCQVSDSSTPVDDWHFDSLPFVVVLLLSDLTGAEGGATVVRKGDGTELAIRIPRPGMAIVLQGQHVEHLAQRATGVTERTTMVTGMIMDDHYTRDDSSLKAGRTYSVQSDLYHQWAVYRLEALAKRAASMQGKLTKGKESGEIFDTCQVSEWCNMLIDHLKKTADELQTV